MSEDMGNAKYSIALRPFKFAYLVLDTDAESYRRIVRLCCTQWGGIHNLIIPVSEDSTIRGEFLRLVAIHACDQFISFLPQSMRTDAAVAKQIAALSQAVPFRRVRIDDGGDFEQSDHSMHAVWVASPHLAEPRTLIVHDFGRDESELLTLFGQIYHGQEEIYASEFSCTRRATSLRDDAVWASQCDDAVNTSVLKLTSAMLSVRRRGNGNDTPMFEIAVAATLYGMCAFWNLRATQNAASFRRRGRRTLLLPGQLLDEKSLARLIQVVRAAGPLAGASSEWDMMFWCETDDLRQQLENLLSCQPKVRKAQSTTLTTHSGTLATLREADPDRDLIYGFGSPVQMMPLFFTEGAGRPELPSKTAFSRGTNELLVQLPAGWSPQHSAIVVLDVSTELWGRFPKDDAAGSLILKHGWFSHGGASAAFLIGAQDTYINVSVPGDFAAVEAYFLRRNYVVRRSPPARYADGLLDLIGGLGNAGFMRSALVYKVLDCLAVKSTKKVAQRLAKEFSIEPSREEDLVAALGHCQAAPELKGVVRTLQQLSDSVGKPARSDLVEVLSWMGAHKLLKRGMHLECPNCKMGTWYPIEKLGEFLTCIGCDYIFPFPVERSQGNEITFEYALNSLVNRVMDQDVLPALLACHVLAGEIQHRAAFAGIELIRKGESNPAAEFDFVVVKNGSMFGGECKVNMTLQVKDIKTARLAADLGLAEFYFCTLKEAFDEQSNKLVEDLQAELKGKQHLMRVGVFTSQELLNARRR